jgi:hypothetical protein
MVVDGQKWTEDEVFFYYEKSESEKVGRSSLAQTVQQEILGMMPLLTKVCGSETGITRELAAGKGKQVLVLVLVLVLYASTHTTITHTKGIFWTNGPS